METLPAYCLACGKYLGEITGISNHLRDVNPLCYKCLNKHIPKLPKFKYKVGVIDLVKVDE